MNLESGKSNWQGKDPSKMKLKLSSSLKNVKGSARYVTRTPAGARFNKAQAKGSG